MNETSKLTTYRRRLGYGEFFQGRGIDIGAGPDPLKAADWPGCENVDPYDFGQGDANFLANVDDDVYDFAYSSHCLEHMNDPYVAMAAWLRVVKKGGFVVVAVPHEIFYEKCRPRHFNQGHVTSWTMEWKSNIPNSVHVPEFITRFHNAVPTKAHTILLDFDFTRFLEDQTRGSAVCQIDFVLRKIG